MKKRIFSLLLIICLLLAACGAKAPEKDANGNPWSKSWVQIGSSIGAEPMSGWTQQRSEDTLAAEGMFYTVWTKGDAFTYENADGNTVTAYDAQIHLVVVESPDPSGAQAYAAQWDQLTGQRYPDARMRSGSFGGQTFDISEYTVTARSANDSLGASATSVRGSIAIHADVLTADGTDPGTILDDFLNSIHFAA